MAGVVGGSAGGLDDEVDGFERRFPAVGALAVLAGTDDDRRAGIETGDGRHGATVGGARWLPTIAASTSPRQPRESPSDPITPASY